MAADAYVTRVVAVREAYDEYGLTLNYISICDVQALSYIDFAATTTLYCVLMHGYNCVMNLFRFHIDETELDSIN